MGVEQSKPKKNIRNFTRRSLKFCKSHKSKPELYSPKLVIPPNYEVIPFNRNSLDYNYLIRETSLTRYEIDQFLALYKQFKPDGSLDKEEFIKLYSEIRPESTEQLNKISSFIFKCFDLDKNGSITFNEFLFAYALTSRGNLERKLNFVFDMYDLNGNEFIEMNELSIVLNGMLEMLGADNTNLDSLTVQCLNDLDLNCDGKVSKEEFTETLMSNYALRTLMSPFS